MAEPCNLQIQISKQPYRSYLLKGSGRNNSLEVYAAGTVDAIGYIKASNNCAGDWFGTSVALSSDGNTLAVGVPRGGSSSIGIGVNQDDNSEADSGAVYLH